MKTGVRLGLMTLLMMIAALVPAEAGAAKRFIPCNPGGGAARAKFKPDSCTVLPMGAAFADGTNLGRLEWKNWGRRGARFTGIERGFHLPLTRIRVHGFAYRPRRAQCGYRRIIFTRVLVRSRFGSDRFRTDSCVAGG